MAQHMNPANAPLRTQAIELADVTRMDLADLVRHCGAESERFYRAQPSDTRYAYELFRRALVERNEAAWEHLFAHYRPLVESWVRRSGAFASSGETSEYFVVAAFARFWRVIPAERFARFPTLASLLQYLQRCTACAVIDSVRAQSWAEICSDEGLESGDDEPAAPDDEALDRVCREEFWAAINAQLHDEAERVVVVSSFVLGMKPRTISARWPKLFRSVNEVYYIKRNVLCRLSRNRELRQMLAA